MTGFYLLAAAMAIGLTYLYHRYRELDRRLQRLEESDEALHDMREPQARRVLLSSSAR